MLWQVKGVYFEVGGELLSLTSLDKLTSPGLSHLVQKIMVIRLILKGECESDMEILHPNVLSW